MPIYGVTAKINSGKPKCREIYDSEREEALAQ